MQEIEIDPDKERQRPFLSTPEGGGLEARAVRRTRKVSARQFYKIMFITPWNYPSYDALC